MVTVTGGLHEMCLLVIDRSGWLNLSLKAKEQKRTKLLEALQIATSVSISECSSVLHKFQSIRSTISQFGCNSCIKKKEKKTDQTANVRNGQILILYTNCVQRFGSTLITSFNFLFRNRYTG